MAAPAQGGFMDEIRKIPPVTRFLCASSLAVSLPVMMKLVSPYKVVFVKEFVTRKWEIWRVWSSFFYGSTGISYIFEMAMLYRTSDSLESGHYAGRSADYAWHTLLSSLAILALNIPLGSFVHSRALLLALTYLSSKLAPAGAQTSLFGLVTLPVAYWPYAMIAMDLVTGGPAAAAQAVTGAVVGHLWWLLLFEWRGAAPQAVEHAPGWLRALVGENAPAPVAGVHVVPPRAREPPRRQAGYNWGTGNRLGTE